MPEPPFDEHAPSATEDERAHRDRWEAVLSGIGGTAQETRRHHFVPQFWLRQWADGSGRVYVVEAGEGVRGFAASTKNVMVVTDLYRAGVAVHAGLDFGPEDWFSAVESAAAGVLEVLVSGTEALSAEQRYDFAFMLALQHLRTPSAISQLVPDDAGLRDWVEQMADLVGGSDEPVLKDTPNDQVAGELRARLDDFVGVERGFGFWNVFHHAHDLAARIYRREWTVIATGGLVFIGDNPVPLSPLGGTTVKIHGSIEVIETPVPLGPQRVLLIGNRPRGLEDGGLLVEPDGYGAACNEIQFARMERFLVGPTE